VDCRSATGAQSEVLAGNGFLPLICGAPSPAQADRVVAHLTNPATFGTPVSIPTISVSQPQYYRPDMWRGPMWVNLNWLVARGLDRYGYSDLARDLRQRPLAEIERWYLRYGSVFEFFDGTPPPPNLIRKGRTAPEFCPLHQVIHDYGWTAALYVDLVWTAR
jgi:neutral trehalase